jgi:glycosyltransferase involved in cell wall biosynthesis
MSNPLVSVVVPVFNGMPFLEVAIDSIIRQDYANMEIVISDDASSDDSRGFISTISDHRVVKLTSQKNAGIFGNLNRCIAHSKGDYIQIMSQDDVMGTGYINSQLSSLQMQPQLQLGFAYSGCRYIDSNGRCLGDSSADGTTEQIDQATYNWIASHFGSLPASISNVMIPRTTINAVGVFDERYRVAGDMEYYNRVSERFKIVRNPAMQLDVRSHPGMATKHPGSGLAYLREEVMLGNWYRSLWSPEEFLEIERFRMKTRGVDHFQWILKAVSRAYLVDAIIGLRLLATQFRIHQVVTWFLLRKLRLSPQARPTLPAPRRVCV